jgi:hypothetical protein
MNNTMPSCPICGESLSVNLARGRKSGKPFVMLRCPADGRHFRGFISHRPYVEQVLDNLETLHQSAAVNNNDYR